MDITGLQQWITFCSGFIQEALNWSLKKQLNSDDDVFKLLLAYAGETCCKAFYKEEHFKNLLKKNGKNNLGDHC